jgi:hypothetical protein
MQRFCRFFGQELPRLAQTARVTNPQWAIRNHVSRRLPLLGPLLRATLYSEIVGSSVFQPFDNDSACRRRTHYLDEKQS